MSLFLMYGIFACIAFIVAVLITRWIFGINKIISALELQNKQGRAQIRLLTKMLLNQGTSLDEIRNIVDKGYDKGYDKNQVQAP